LMETRKKKLGMRLSRLIHQLQLLPKLDHFMIIVDAIELKESLQDISANTCLMHVPGLELCLITNQKCSITGYGTKWQF